MNYANTRIYVQALALVSLTRSIIEELPIGFGFLADQLRRAAASVVLTFAEGYDKGSLAEQRRFFRMSRGSVQEVAAILDVAHRLGAISDSHYEQGHELADHLVRMLFLFRAKR